MTRVLDVPTLELFFALTFSVDALDFGVPSMSLLSKTPIAGYRLARPVSEPGVLSSKDVSRVRRKVPTGMRSQRLRFSIGAEAVEVEGDSQLSCEGVDGSNIPGSVSKNDASKTSSRSIASVDEGSSEV